MTATISGTTGGIGLIGSGTAKNSTSGTSIDFTGIPAGAKRVTVMFNGVSTNGSSAVQVQIGSSSGVEATGYESTGGYVITGTSSSAVASTTGYVIEGNHGSYTVAAIARSGLLTITNVSGNIWTASGSFGRANGPATTAGMCGGTKTLSGTLDRVRITTVNGTDTFDAGSVNILYE